VVGPALPISAGVHLMTGIYDAEGLHYRDKAEWQLCNMRMSSENLMQGLAKN
jgi:hypothetical protein